MADETLTPRQVRQRIDTLAAIAYGAEISTKLAADETASATEREHAAESAEVMTRAIALGLAELSRELKA
jgi:hypothetical protein